MKQEIKVYTNASVNLSYALKTKDEVVNVARDTFENKGELALLRVCQTGRDDSGIRLISAIPDRNPQVYAISLAPESDFVTLRGHTYRPLSEFMDKLCNLVPELKQKQSKVFRIDRDIPWGKHPKEKDYTPRDIYYLNNIEDRSRGKLEVVSSPSELDIQSRLAALVNPQATIVQEMFMGALI